MATYFVLGTDNREYGPVMTDELRKWIVEGRADAQTKVRIEGTENWLPLGQIPEFADAPARKAASPPPIQPAAAGKTSGLAIASLALGICGLFTCGATALFGLILGIIAMVRITNSRGAITGKGNALAGIIVSGVMLIMVPIFAAMLLPALSAAQKKAQQINCVNNEKQLALAIRIYSGDHKDQYPPAATWCDAIQATAGSDKVFRCPAQSNTERCGYAFNAKLDGLDTSKADPHTVMLFESDAGWNAHGGADMEVGRHGKHAMAVAFADGSVQIIPESRLSTLRWDP